MHTPNPTKRVSAFGALILGVSAIAITLILSGSAIAIYAMTIVDRKADNLVDAAHMVLQELPAIRAALPPALSDALNDERRPNYAAHMKIDVALPAESEYGRRNCPVVSVENCGDQVVTMLALRVVALDQRRNPVHEWTEYLATPLTIEDEWRGPLLPSSTRRAVLSRSFPKDTHALEYEITELRVWNQTHASEAHHSPTGPAPEDTGGLPGAGTATIRCTNPPAPEGPPELDPQA